MVDRRILLVVRKVQRARLHRSVKQLLFVAHPKEADEPLLLCRMCFMMRSWIRFMFEQCLRCSVTLVF
jgi:hypothetical protein